MRSKSIDTKKTENMEREMALFLELASAKETEILLAILFIINRANDDYQKKKGELLEQLYMVAYPYINGHKHQATLEQARETIIATTLTNIDEALKEKL